MKSNIKQLLSVKFQKNNALLRDSLGFDMNGIRFNLQLFPLLNSQTRRLLVFIQVRFQYKSFFTFETAEIFFWRMRHHMCTQITSICERFPTVRAPVGLFSRV